MPKKKAMLKREEVDLVLRKNFKNIVDKVAQGKVLNGDERAVLLAGLENDDEPRVRSWVALSKVLGVSRQTLWNLRDRSGGPDTFSVKHWQEFLADHADASGHHMTHGYASEEVSKLRAKLLTAQAGKEEAIRRLKELELERTEKGLVPASEARQCIKAVLMPLREFLDALPKSTALEANPEEPNRAEEAFRAGLDKVYLMIQKEVKE